MKFSWLRHDLIFNFAAGTSRGVLKLKPSFFLVLEDDNNGIAISECSLIPKLSIDEINKIPDLLNGLAQNPSACLGAHSHLNDYPALQFALECLQLSFERQNCFELFPSNFTDGKVSIPINGLIWMGSEKFMHKQIEEKLEAGFRVIKLKIGAIDTKQELALLQSIRNSYNPSDIEIRVDANGAFDLKQSRDVLSKLAELGVHSIEQPIKPSNKEELAILAKENIIPIALDESLIGIVDQKNKETLLDQVKPQYIIIKPSLIGGFRSAEEWIKLAEERQIGWWATSALESNIGLNAIAQWAFHQKPNFIHGLGTGGLFQNNIPSPLYIKRGKLGYSSENHWNLNILSEKKKLV